MEFFAHMNFLFWASLFFLIGFALCIHFDVYGIKKKVTNSFLSIFHVVLPDGKDENTKELKLKMAKAATFIAYAVLFVFLVSVLLSFALPYSRSDAENTYTGPLGDLFNGLLTPLLTFLTFCGLLITIMIQNVQMKSTLQELELTRKEMAESTDALQEQVKNSTAQKFDSNFYEMLKFHMTVIDNIDENDISREISFFNRESRNWNRLKSPDKFRRFFLINYQILKFINTNEELKVITRAQAKDYSNIIRSMLSENVYALIFINSLNNNFFKYKVLIEKYEFLEHFAFTGFNDAHILKHIRGYSVLVFGSRDNLDNFLNNKSYEIFSFAFDALNSFVKDVKNNNFSVLSYFSANNEDHVRYKKMFHIIKNYEKTLRSHVNKIDILRNKLNLYDIFKSEINVDILSLKDRRSFFEATDFNLLEFCNDYESFSKDLEVFTMRHLMVDEYIDFKNLYLRDVNDDAQFKQQED